MKIDIYEIVTKHILELLERNTVPWRKPWKGQSEAPQNYISRKAYRGINALLLHTAWFASPFWLTFSQVESLGGRVRKGEKAFPVVFWKLFEDDEMTEKRKVPLLRYYNVFNLKQCEGIAVGKSDAPEVPPPLETCEQVVKEMPNPPRVWQGFQHASYDPLNDLIVIPGRESFFSPEEYYSTLFHELIHSTGHTSRLNRKEVATPNAFGSDPYSREELVAEMGAAFLCSHAGIAVKTIENSAAYIQAWITRLKEDRRLVIQAAGQAQRATDYILNVTFEEESERKPASESVGAL